MQVIHLYRQPETSHTDVRRSLVLPTWVLFLSLEVVLAHPVSERQDLVTLTLRSIVTFVLFPHAGPALETCWLGLSLPLRNLTGVPSFTKHTFGRRQRPRFLLLPTSNGWSCCDDILSTTFIIPSRVNASNRCEAAPVSATK